MVTHSNQADYQPQYEKSPILSSVTANVPHVCRFFFKESFVGASLAEDSLAATIPIHQSTKKSFYYKHLANTIVRKILQKLQFPCYFFVIFATNYYRGRPKRSQLSDRKEDGSKMMCLCAYRKSFTKILIFSHLTKFLKLKMFN